jgi:hypothetical protein
LRLERPARQNGATENVVPCLLCVYAKKRRFKWDQIHPNFYKDYKVLPERCDEGHVQIFLLFTADKIVPLRVHLKASAPSCVHSFKNAIALCAQLQDCGTPACTAKAAASLHASLKAAERLLVQLTKCSCTPACCCNPLKTAKRQLHPCGHNFKTTATLCAQFQDSCNPVCSVSRQLHLCVHSFKTAESLCAQLQNS